MNDFRDQFLDFAMACDVLRFGEFITKAGRKTPYFFNAGLFNDGERLRRLGQFYAAAYLASGIQCDHSTALRNPSQDGYVSMPK